MLRFLQSSWMAVLAGVLSYTGATILAWPKFTAPPPSAEAGHPEDKANIDASWNFRSEEIDQLMGDLRKEKEALAIREQQLNELALRLQNERMELNQITQMVFRMQRDFDTNIVRVRDEEIPNLKKLVKIYGAMTPDAAASVLKELDDERIVKILVYMKESETAPILEILAKSGDTDAKRAAQITDRLRLSISRPASTSKGKSS